MNNVNMGQPLDRSIDRLIRRKEERSADKQDEHI